MAKKRKREKWETYYTRALKRGRSSLLQKYGLTPEQYTRMFNQQGGVCFICQRHPKDMRPRMLLAVDHCHSTGRIRGLLCRVCNSVLLARCLRDDPERALRAHKYLTRRTKYGKVPET